MNLLPVILALAIGGSFSCAPVHPASARSDRVPATGQDWLAGTFSIVYGDRERYFLFDTTAQATVELLLTADSSGVSSQHLRKYDRQNVCVAGFRQKQDEKHFFLTEIVMAPCRAGRLT